MEEHRLAPHAMTAKELLPILWRRQMRGFALLSFFYGFGVGGLIAWVVDRAAAWFAAPAAFVVMFLLLRFVTLPRQIRKLDPLFFANRQVVISEQGCAWTFEGGLHSFLPWSLTRKAECYRGVYLLYLPGGNYLQLPRRALSQDQEQFLIERLRSFGLLRD
jgi:hypothetical protein